MAIIKKSIFQCHDKTLYSLIDGSKKNLPEKRLIAQMLKKDSIIIL